MIIDHDCLDLFSMFHKIGSCLTLYFLCCYANYVCILEATFVRKKCTLYTGKHGSLKIFCFLFYHFCLRA